MGSRECPSCGSTMVEQDEWHLRCPYCKRVDRQESLERYNISKRSFGFRGQLHREEYIRSEIAALEALLQSKSVRSKRSLRTTEIVLIVVSSVITVTALSLGSVFLLVFGLTSLALVVLLLLFRMAGDDSPSVTDFESRDRTVAEQQLAELKADLAHLSQG